MAAELLTELDADVDVDLAKADVFALGASIYELASEERLPEAGSSYHVFRSGGSTPLTVLCTRFPTVPLLTSLFWVAASLPNLRGRDCAPQIPIHRPPSQRA